MWSSPAVFFYLTYLMRYALQVAVTKYDISLYILGQRDIISSCRKA
jgi:hypothetical protein